MPVILDVKVDNVSREQAIARIDLMLRDGGQHIITTPNPEFVVAAQKDKDFMNILNRASLALPDGFGLILAAKFLGIPLKERIVGSDFVWDLAKLAAEKGHTVYLLGGKGSVVEHAAQELRMKNHELRIVGYDAGPNLNSPTAPLYSLAIIGRIREACPDILLVAFGQIKQEKWIAKHLGDLRSVKIAIGVGGAFDFIAGRVRRAPLFLRLLGLEWFWRLLRQPWRLPRIYRAVIKFSYFILKAKLARVQHPDKY